MIRFKTLRVLILLLSVTTIGCTRFTEMNEHGGALRGPDCDCYQTEYRPEMDNF